MKIEGHNVNPVILELPEDETSRNNSLIRKMMRDQTSNIHMSGGFKNVNASKIDNCITKSLYRPEPKNISEESVLRDIGVSKVQPKYRD